MHVKKMFIRSILCVEMCLFGYLYIYGKNGLYMLQQQRSALITCEQEITQLNKELLLLENDIFAWQTDDFYKEKIAREQLQMARKKDKLFYTGS